MDGRTDGRKDGRGTSPPGGGDPGRDRPPITVLFLDPDFLSAQQLAEAIGPSSVTTIVATASQALAAIGKRVPQVIVTELDLPDADGLELIARWRSAPATRHTLLMVVTSRRSVQEKVAGFRAGADDFLIKPVDPLQFMLHFLTISRFRQVLGRSASGLYQ
jgi:DNA-binding response OmpR family regulator